MRTVEIALVLRHLLRAIHEVLESFLIKCADGLAKVAKSLSLFEVEHFAAEVLHDPREDRVLREVAERAVGKRIQLEQVVVVRACALHPKPSVVADSTLRLAVLASVLEDALVDLIAFECVGKGEKHLITLSPKL